MSETMRAAVYHGPRELRIEERPIPKPGPHDALIEVSHCGVCGTDLHLVLEGMGRPDTIGGHEYSGRIAALGEEVSGEWQLGDRVVGGPERPCGSCDYCRARRPSLCAERGGFDAETPFQGAFAAYKQVHASQLFRVPDGLALRDAALAEPLAVALHAITLSGVEAGQRALLTGAGPIGLLVLAALRARGVAETIVSEPSPVRRDRAARVGAARVVEPDALTTPAMPFDVVEGAFDVAFECSGNPRAMESALAQLRRLGRLVFVGTGMRRPKLDVNRVLLNELVVTGAYNYDWNGFQDALDLLACGKLPTDLLIESDDVPLANLFQTLEGLAAGEIGGKVMIVPR
jgi:2-desacetyl-2-hydroxyethyl bacteriochlorophyllide A dehydrogenase